MPRFAVEVERNHGFGPEFLLLRDEQGRLNLIVGGFGVVPERARGALALVKGHLLPSRAGVNVVSVMSSAV